MLFNPNWKQPKVKHEFMTLPHLIEWLRTKPANKSYTYVSQWTFLLAKYIRAEGYWFPSVGPYYYSTHLFCQDGGLPPYFNSIAVGRPRTFGGALQRAEKFLKNYTEEHGW